MGPARCLAVSLLGARPSGVCPRKVILRRGLVTEARLDPESLVRAASCLARGLFPTASPATTPSVIAILGPYQTLKPIGILDLGL